MKSLILSLMFVFSIGAWAIGPNTPIPQYCSGTSQEDSSIEIELNYDIENDEYRMTDSGEYLYTLKIPEIRTSFYRFKGEITNVRTLVPGRAHWAMELGPGDFEVLKGVLTTTIVTEITKYDVVCEYRI